MKTMVLAVVMAAGLLVSMPGRAGAGPNVAGGGFAWSLWKVVDGVESERSLTQIMGAIESGQSSEAAINLAVQELSARGLTPYRGWRVTEPLSMHDVTSLLVRLHKAESNVKVSDADACHEFVTGRGCDPSTLHSVLMHAFQTLMNHKSGGGAEDGDEVY